MIELAAVTYLRQRQRKAKLSSFIGKKLQICVLLLIYFSTINYSCMSHTKSSKRWLQEHFDDKFVKKAQNEGYRSRAIYKLKEIDLRDELILPGMTVVDLGAAPGGWTQYITEKLQQNGLIIAVDILPMDNLPGVNFIHGDFTEEVILQKLLNLLSGRNVDLVLSDMAPNMSGLTAVDIPRSMYLAELAVDFAGKVLKPGGTLLMKVFQGAGFEQLVRQLRSEFKKVIMRKPEASRARSRETYLLAKEYISKA